MPRIGEFTRRVNILLNACDELYNLVVDQPALNPFSVKRYTEDIKKKADYAADYAKEHNLRVRYDHMENMIEAAQLMSGIVQILAEKGAQDAAEDVREAKDELMHIQQ